MSDRNLAVYKVLVNTDLDGAEFLAAKKAGKATSFTEELTFAEAMRIYSKAWVVRQLENELQRLKLDT